MELLQLHPPITLTETHSHIPLEKQAVCRNAATPQNGRKEGKDPSSNKLVFLRTVMILSHEDPWDPP